jgi:uncharacterized protein
MKGLRGYHPPLTHPDVIPVPSHVWCHELGEKVGIKSCSPRQWVAKTGMALRVTTGSEAYGTALDDGQGDLDEMGICIEPPQYVIGGNRFEEYKYRSAEPDGPGAQSARSKPGDLDLTVYGLRKFAALAKAGNPSILLTLFTPDEHVKYCTEFGQELRDRAHLFVSKSAGPRFLGYLARQRDGLLGKRSGGTRNQGRADIREKFGWDVKFGMHMVRLGLQGVELLETGRMELPIPEPHREYLRDMRRGKYTLEEALAKTEKLETRIKRLLDGESRLPDKPNVQAIDEWLISVHRRHWKWDK